MRMREKTVRELSVHELELVGGGVGGFSLKLTVSPENTTLAASGVGDGNIGGSGAGGGSGLGGLVGGLLGSLL